MAVSMENLAKNKKVKMIRTSLLPSHDKGAEGVPAFVPRDWPVGLTFLRNCFNKLREMEEEQEDGVDISCEKGEEPHVSLAHFQRVMSRLMKCLCCDTSSFDPRVYDYEGNNRIAFRGFAECWRDLKMQTTLFPLERIFITFDASGASSSKAGRTVSTTIMLCILLSSTSFILSTLQGALWQDKECPSCKPTPKPVFNQIEEACLVVFTTEFLLRFLTSPFVRIQLLNQDFIIEKLCGDEKIQWAGPQERVIAFCKEPTNIIDFLAIAPYYLEKMVDTNTNLMVLRLVRLTRMFRILRLGKLSDAMDKLVTAFELSLPSLYVLGFYICLGILVTSSIVYYAEAGTWDPHDGVYKVMNPLTKEMQETLFVSIPDAFWWNIVTVTTVGYGDLYPTTPMGKFFGSITIVAGVIVFAMPVGVISSNFSRVWDDAAKDVTTLQYMTIAETEAATVGFGFDHTGYNRSMVKIEVFDDMGYGAEPGFLGESFIDCAKLGWQANATSGASVKLTLENNVAIQKSKKLNGTLQVDMIYEPNVKEPAAQGEATDAPKSQPDASPKERLLKFVEKFGSRQLQPHKGAQIMKGVPFSEVVAEFWRRPEVPELNGTLTVRVVSASKLTNLSDRLQGISDPFCRITVYSSLEVGSPSETFQTEVVYNNLNPEWNIDTSTHSWKVDWSSTKRSMRADSSAEASSGHPAVHPAWENELGKRHSAVVSLASGLGEGRGDDSPRANTDTPLAPFGHLSPSDPEYVVKKMITDLQREVEFWKDKEETEQRQQRQRDRLR